jgi:hypothetical protein
VVPRTMLNLLRLDFDKIVTFVVIGKPDQWILEKTRKPFLNLKRYVESPPLSEISYWLQSSFHQGVVR